MQVNASVSSPSLSQTALTSHGSLRQGSGTVKNIIMRSSDSGYKKKSHQPLTRTVEAISHSEWR